MLEVLFAIFFLFVNVREVLIHLHPTCSYELGKQNKMN